MNIVNFTCYGAGFFLAGLLWFFASNKAEEQKGAVTIEDYIAIEKVLAGDTQAFRTLVDNYSRLVYTSVVKIVRDSDIAQDISQDAFLQAFRALADFRRESAFSTWLVRIAVNKALDHCRRQKARPPAGELHDYLLEGIELSPEAEVMRKEEVWQMRQQILELPGIYRKVIYAYYFQELSYRDIAQSEGISVKTVESRLYRARAMLRESMEGGGGENVSMP